MALDLGDLDQYFDASAQVTIGGKQYRIPPVSYEIGLWARRATVRRAALGDDATPEQMAEASAKTEQELGPPPIPDGQSWEEAMLSPELVAELVADGVPDEAVKHLAHIIYARILGGDDLALAFAKGVDDPNPAGPANRAERRAAKKAASRKAASGSKTMSTAEAATTQKRGSGRGTKSPLKSSGAGKAVASRGAKS